MNNKLTYKLQDIVVKNQYVEVIIKNKIKDEEISINDAHIFFRYEPKKDIGYLSFGKSKESTVCEVNDESINEVIVYDDSLSIETNEKIYYCYKDKDKIYF